MTEYLTGADLASFLERDESAAIDNIVTRTNALVDEEWATPRFPVPQWVVNIAWDVAVRAGANPTGLTSTTKAWDDISRTDRFEAGTGFGVYLTDDEKTKLHDDAPTAVAVGVKSIRMSIPGWSRPLGGRPWC